MKFTKRWQRWLGIIMTVVLVTGPLQAFSYAAETGETAVGAEAVAGGGSIDPAEEKGQAAEYSGEEISGEAEQEGDPVDEDAADGEDGSAAEDADPAEDADSAEDARDQSDDRGRDFSDDEEEEQSIYEEEGSDDFGDDESRTEDEWESPEQDTVGTHADELTAEQVRSFQNNVKIWKADDQITIVYDSEEDLELAYGIYSGSTDELLYTGIIQRDEESSLYYAAVRFDAANKAGHADDEDFEKTDIRNIPVTIVIDDGIAQYEQIVSQEMDPVVIEDADPEEDDGISLKWSEIESADGYSVIVRGKDEDVIILEYDTEENRIALNVSKDSAAGIEVAPYKYDEDGVKYFGEAASYDLTGTEKEKEGHEEESGEDSEEEIIEEAADEIWQVRDAKLTSLSDCIISLSETSYVYDGNPKRPSVTVTYNGEVLSYSNGDYTLEYYNNRSAGIGSVVIEGQNGYTGSITRTFFIEKATPTLSFNCVNEVKYLFDSAFTIPLFNKITDGTVSFSSSNSSVVTVERSTGEVTIKGAGRATVTAYASEGENYKAGSTSYGVTVRPYDIFECTISLPTENYVYTGQPIKPSPMISNSFAELVNGTDYTVTYSDNTDVGKATITVNGKGNYCGTNTHFFTISEAEPTLIFESPSVSKKVSDSPFTNPLTSISDGYIYYSSSNNSVAEVNSSTGVVTIKGAGTAIITVHAGYGKNYKSGSAAYNLSVQGIDLSECTISIPAEDYSYTGQAIEPIPTISIGAAELINGTDYTVAYSDNTSVGTATITATGKGNYAGTVSRTFTISKAEPALSFENTSVTKTIRDSAFTNTLTAATDGTVSYLSSDTSVAAVDSSTGEVTVKGTGSATITASAAEGKNYKGGTASYTLTVQPYDISGKISVGLSSTSMVYTGEELTPDVTIYIGTEALTEHQDYEIEFEDNINAGNAKILITGKGNYTGSGWTAFSITKAAPALAFENASVTKMMFGSDFTNTLTVKTDGTVAFTSDNASVAEVDSETGKVTIKGVGDATITVSASEGANYTAGTAEYTLIVEPYGISACTVTIPAESYDYTGQAAEPSPTIKRGTATLVPETDYTVAYSDNINAGTATITATGIGEYTGTVSKTFTIAKIEPSLAFAEASVSKTTADAAFTNELTKTTDGAVTFSSDNTAVAEVDSTTGEVTLKGAGTATITAAAAEGTNYTAGSASYTLTVTEAGGGLSLEDLTYSFANSAFSFGYPKDYVIPLSSYQAIFGNTTKAAWYYKIQSTWGGSCMGFSSTAALLYDPDNGLYPSGFNPGAGRISDLNVQDQNSSIGMNVTQFIEAMQISQKTQQVKDTISSNRVYTSDIRRGDKDLNGLYSTVQGQTEAKKPVIIAVYQNGGHAILAYKTEDVSGTESRIYVYDNNFPSSERYITLNKDSAGNYTSWSYNMGGYYGTWGTSSSSSSISCIPYSVIEHVWANRGDVNEIQNVVRFNSRNIALFDADNRLAATIVDGQILTNNSRIRLVEDDLEAGGSSDDGYTLVSMPVDVYTVKNLDSGTESLELAVVDTNLGASVDTTAKEVTFIVDDSNDLNSILIKAEEDESYRIELNSSFEHGHDMEIKGYGSGETMEVSQESGYISINNCQILNLTVDGVEVKKYTVSASAGEGGSISPSGESTVIRDMDTTYTIAPDSGYVIEDVKVDGKSVGAVTSYTFKQVRADHSITASFKKSVTLPGKTTRGDMFNLANNVKVTWKAVQGAKYYKVYREGVTDLAETRKDPVIVTAGLVGWDKDPGLTNGHAYRYKIVASLTGKGDSSGDSKLSYSKVMYRLKTVVIRSVKNLEPGKVTVKYDKTTSGDSYVLQYSEKQDMTGARTKVVLGASNTSYVIGGLKKGKTYYISIRVRKKVNGIDYYTTFGVPKKVTVTK